MPDVVKVGPLLIQGEVLVVLLAWIVAYAGFSLWARSFPYVVPLKDMYFAMSLIVALSWKFGYILFDPMTFIKQPMSVLFLSGSTREITIGILLAIMYGAWKMYKARLPWKGMLDATVFCGVLFFSVYALLTPRYGGETVLPWGIHVVEGGRAYHPIHVYIAIGFVGLSILLWMMRQVIGNGYVAAKGLSYAGIIMLVVSFFSDAEVRWFYLNTDQMVALVFIVLGYALHSKRILMRE